MKVIEAAEARTEVAAPTRRRPDLRVTLFCLTSFVGAGLLFAVEPMVAKLLLPLLGGSAAVWNTAMVFFQAALLLGYLWAHVTTSRLGVRRHLAPQLLVFALPVLLLPVGIPKGWLPPDDLAPALWTLIVMVVIVGGPFFALATASPTLQRWFSTTDHPAASDPYFLYAAGNAGSLIGLIGYPLVFERFDLHDQARAWEVGYVVFVALAAACALVVRSGRGTPVTVVAADHAPPVSWTQRARWVGLAFAPSALLLGVTRYLSTDIASVPLLWILPLSLYLVTFIVAFGSGSDRPGRIAGRALRIMIVPVALTFLGLQSEAIVGVVVNGVAFFLAAMACHGRLAATRPAASRLTDFYLWVSVGGVLGGITASLIAPLLFDTIIEYPIALVLALLALPAFDGALSVARPIRWAAVVAGVGLVALAAVVRERGENKSVILAMLLLALVSGGAYLLARRPRTFAVWMALVLAVSVFVDTNHTVRRERTFFGVYRVYEDEPGRHVFTSGTTIHGMERLSGAHAGAPMTYYYPASPIGQLLNKVVDEPGKDSFGVVGLGTGALAAYGRSDDHFTFYEIDQAVVDIAEDPSLFTYLSDARASIDVVVGDGRLRLMEPGAPRYDVLVLDAFSSDAIPVHLITREAVDLYTHRLAAGGVLAFHISNRYLDLAPILARISSDLGLEARYRGDTPSRAGFAAGGVPSLWVVMGPAASVDGAVSGLDGWHRLRPADGSPLWTDSYSDVLSVFRWW